MVKRSKEYLTLDFFKPKYYLYYFFEYVYRILKSQGICTTGVLVLLRIYVTL